jgi:long-chain fatty acid transport protein
MRSTFFHSGTTLVCVVSASLLPCWGNVHAAGFALNEMSAAAIGNAFAGAGATAADASTIYYNPAGLSHMTGRQFSVTGSAVRPSIRFENQGSVTATGSRLSGGNGGDAGSWAAVPAMYYAADLGPAWRFGIGLQSAFGLKTEYDNGWAGRYQALKSELTTFNLNPTLAYAVNERLSVGMGISAQYAKVELSRALDFGSACAGALGLARCAPAGYLPQARDGKVTLDGKDWAFGFNLGALYMPDAGTRFGLAYRSSIRHKLSGGDAHFEKPAGLPGPLAAAAAFADTSVTAGLDLPETINFSAYKEINSKWALLGDINWTRWSRFNELRVQFGNGAPDSVIRESWRNSTRFGAGVNYRYNDAWLLRGGISYERSPVQDAFRTPSIPDASRRILAFGLQYRPTPQNVWDLAVAHVFINDASIHRADSPLGGRLVGKYQNDVNIVSLQYSHAF